MLKCWTNIPISHRKTWSHYHLKSRFDLINLISFRMNWKEHTPSNFLYKICSNSDRWWFNVYLINKVTFALSLDLIYFMMPGIIEWWLHTIDTYWLSSCPWIIWNLCTIYLKFFNAINVKRDPCEAMYYLFVFLEQRF